MRFSTERPLDSAIACATVRCSTATPVISSIALLLPSAARVRLSGVGFGVSRGATLGHGWTAACAAEPLRSRTLMDSPMPRQVSAATTVTQIGVPVGGGSGMLDGYAGGGAEGGDVTNFSF